MARLEVRIHGPKVLSENIDPFTKPTTRKLIASGDAITSKPTNPVAARYDLSLSTELVVGTDRTKDPVCENKWMIRTERERTHLSCSSS